MNYMRLLKILYIAERECLAESGKPLAGGRILAMERGPVLEEVYRLIRSESYHTPEWAKYIRTDEYELELVDDPGVGKLTTFIVDKLDQIAERHKRDDEWEMVRITHLLQEWRKNDPGKSSKEIPLTDILEAVGRAADVQRIVENDKRDFQMAAFFADRP